MIYFLINTRIVLNFNFLNLQIRYNLNLGFLLKIVFQVLAIDAGIIPDDRFSEHYEHVRFQLREKQMQQYLIKTVTWCLIGSHTSHCTSLFVHVLLSLFMHFVACASNY